MTPKFDTIIVGGGAIGCAIAYFLAKAKVKSIVIDKGKVGGEASGAAAGMLAPLGESKGPGPFLSLGLQSLSCYPSLAQELSNSTGISIDYNPSGILWTAFSDEELIQLQKRLSWQTRLNLDVKFMDRAELRDHAPYVGPRAQGAILSTDEGHVNSQHLTKALAEGARLRGAQILEDTEVTGLLTENSRVRGVQIGGKPLWADHVVLAPGAWAADLGLMLGFKLPVHPVKGQIISVKSSSLKIEHIVFWDHAFIVSKGNGSIWIGATQENVGFDKKPTTDGRRYLLNQAYSLVPSIEQATLGKTWAGLRPGSPDDMPILGSVPGWDGITLAIGHFRNGILLAPITGQLIAETIVSGDVTSLHPFSIRRFGKTQ